MRNPAFKPKRTPQNLRPIVRIEHYSQHLGNTELFLPTIYMHNMRSITLDKFNELKLIADNYDIIMITESWLNKSKVQLYTLDNHSIHHCHRGGRRGGGVAAYIKSDMPILKLCDYTDKHLSAYWFMLQQPNQNPIIYGLIYHPPGLRKIQKDASTNYIIKTMAQLQNKHKS